MTRHGLFGLAVAGLAAACAQTPSEVLVTVESDLTAGADLDACDVVVTGADGQMATASYTLGPGGVTIPFSLGLLPKDAGDESLTVSAVGLQGADEVVRQTASTSFTPHEVRGLVLRLERACLGVACDPGATCSAGACGPSARDPRSLPPAGN